MVATKTGQLDKTEALNVIYGFYKQLQLWIQHTTTPKISDLEHYFSKNFHISCNGQTIGKTSADYLPRLQKFQKKYSRMEVSKPLEEPVVSGHEIAFHYQVELTTRSGERKTVQIMAVGTIEDHKIARWVQVAHEHGLGDWDK